MKEEKSMTTFDQQYAEALEKIMVSGIEETNERTGYKTKSLPGMNFTITSHFPLLSLRKVPVKLFVAEQIWFMMGSRRPSEFLNNHTKIWNDFANINGVVTAAYGYRWKRFFDRDQLHLLIDLLENEPSSRHGVVVAWDPASDGLNRHRRRKNVPCPFAFTVNIIGGALHFHNIVRSNDMILGFPHDVAGFVLLQHFLASRLGVSVGQYTHSISNAHIYETHYAAAQEMIDRKGQENEIELNIESGWFERAESGDDQLVLEITKLLTSQYNPCPRIKGLKIVL